MNDMPIVTITLDHMKHTLQHAFAGSLGEIQEIAEQEIEACCSTGHIAELVKQHARDEINRAIQAALSNYFRVGDGRTAIVEGIAEELGKMGYPSNGK